MYALCLALAVLLMGWIHTRTDEIPIVLAVLTVVSAAVAALFPKRYFFTGVVLGAVLFATETLVHLGLLNAPYAPSVGLPWPALVAYVPAALGTAAGRLARGAVRTTGSRPSSAE